MSNELLEQIDNLISYYEYHSMEEFVKGNDERLQNFVIEDFSKLLRSLEKEYQSQT